ncbi:restriction endonuclease subunit S [Kribbella sp. CCNWLW197]
MWASPRELKRFAVSNGDLLICEGGDVGRAAIYAGPDGFIFQNSVHRVRSASGNDLRYFRYVLEAVHGTEWFDVLCNKATIRHLTSEKLADLPIPLPEPTEQRRIADFLDAETSTVDRLLASRRRQLILLGERLSARVMEVTGRLTVRGVAASQEWQRLPLRRVVASIKTGSTPSGGADGTWATPDDPGALPWYTPSEMDEWMNLAPPERFVDSGGGGERGTTRFESGAVLVVCVGESIGKTVFLDHAASGNQQLTAVKPSDRVDGKFLAWQLWGASQEIRDSSPYTRVRIINGGDLLAFPVAAPPRLVQVAVRKELDIEAGKLTTLRDSIARFTAGLAERRHALITAAVTGQIDVTTARGVEVP